MKKFFTLVFATMMAANMMAQHESMSFAGKSHISVTAQVTVDIPNESDTVKFDMKASSITFPTMKGDVTVPSFIVNNVSYDMDMSKHLVTMSEQDFSTTTINENGVEKKVEGKLSGTFSLEDYKMSIKAVFKYGDMPFPLTYTIDAYYVKPIEAKPLYVSVGGKFNYQNESVTYNVRKYMDGDVEKLDVEIPTYELKNTVMGDLTLGTYTVTGLTYDEAKGGYYRDYKDDELTFHFTAVNGGKTNMDGDYAFNSEKDNNILVTYSGTTVDDIKNTFQMGSMPFGIVSTFKSSTSSISSVSTNETVNANAKMYNLSGQQVNDSYKGVVIVNGKKYINK